MNEPKKARAIGVNHVALEVGDIDEALEFYSGFLEFELRSRSDNAVFIDLGDQFINFSRGRRQAPEAWKTAMAFHACPRSWPRREARACPIRRRPVSLSLMKTGAGNPGLRVIAWP